MQSFVIRLYEAYKRLILKAVHAHTKSTNLVFLVCTLSSHMSTETILLANAWAIHRDPKLWDDAESFKLERFENGESESYKLFPFGLGRRSSPGKGLAQRVVGLTLGSLIQCFEWERIGEEEVDMAEGKVLTMLKAVPLVAMCKARPIMNIVLSEAVDDI